MRSKNIRENLIEFSENVLHEYVPIDSTRDYI